MKLALSQIVALTLSTPVAADDWRNWYVGIAPGAAHVMMVEEPDAQGIRAGVASIDQNGDRVMFVLSCSRLHDPDSGDLTAGIRWRFAIAGSLRDVVPPIELLASFEQSPPNPLGTFSFLGGVLGGDLTPQLLAQLMSSDELKITSPDGAFTTKFSLVGADEAIADIKCWGDLP